MSIRNAVWWLGMCAGITLSANTYAIVLFQSESVSSAAPQFEYHVPRLRAEAEGTEGTEGTGGHSSHPSWNRSSAFFLPLAAGYFDMLPLSEDSASPLTGSYLSLPGRNEAFGVNIPGFINDEAGLVSMPAVPDLFMQAQWQPAEGNSQTTPFTPHSYSGNVARVRNRAQVCAQAREVRRNRLEPRDGPRDGDCIGFGGGSDGSGNANGNGSRAGGSASAIAARNRNVRDGSALDSAYMGGGGGGGGGTGEGLRDAATPGAGESGESSKGGGMSPPASNNSDLDNSEGNPGGVEGGSSQDNGNGGTGEGNGGSGGIGGNEDWDNGNGDAWNWNDPEEGEGSPSSEIAVLPEPATVGLLALGLAALCAVRGNQAGSRAGVVDRGPC